MILPKPYYQDDWVTLYNCRSENILSELPKIDVVLTDPPYGIELEYDKSFLDNRDYIQKICVPIIQRLSETVPLVALTPGNGNQYFYPIPSWTMAFGTTAGAGRCSWGFSCWQPIMVYGKDPYLANGMGARSDIFIHTESSEKNGHPCPKPIGLWKKILQRISVKETDVIFDPFCGSATTLVAAKMLKRKAIGIEMNEKYCEIAVKQRLNKSIPLFEPEQPLSLL